MPSSPRPLRAPPKQTPSGSGLSRDNSVTAEQLTALIRAVLARDGGELYRDALPIAGRTKKLARRMRGTSSSRPSLWSKLTAVFSFSFASAAAPRS